MITNSAKVVTNSRFVAVQMAEIAVPNTRFAGVIERTQWSGVPPPVFVVGLVNAPTVASVRSRA